MERRKFFKETGMLAIGIGVFGKLTFAEDRYIGDTPATTDILGPFYRPGAPVRTNINSKEYTGKLFHLSGTIFKEDGKTPFKNAVIEIWQCDENRVYDNISVDYNYRGTQKTGADGKYHFIGMHPIPYPVGINDIWRPAHIHMLVSGEGQQDLITQVYLEGDPHLKKDMGSMSPQAVKRVLKIVTNGKGEEGVQFDIVMAKEFRPDNSVYEKLCGVYKMSDGSMMEFTRKGDFLMLKWNSQIMEGLSYKGNNSFSGGAENSTVANFELLANGGIQVKLSMRSITRGETRIEGSMLFNYKG